MSKIFSLDSSDQIDKMYKHIQIPEILPNPILPADFYISYSLYLISR